VQLSWGKGALAAVSVSVVATALLASPVARAQSEDDCIAASERAVSFHKMSKLIEERTALQACAVPACPDVVRASCDQRLTAVSAAIPSLLLSVVDSSGKDITSVRVAIDGTPYAGALGAPIVMNPGDHELRVEAAGEPTITTHVVLREGDVSKREVVTIVAEAPPPPSSMPTATAGGDGSSLRTIGFVVGGVGIAGIVAGSVFGLTASSTWSNAKSECTSVATCGAGSQAQNDHDSAASQATTSTIAFAVGGAALATGVVLWIVGNGKRPGEGRSGRSLQVAPGVASSGGSLWLRGEF
jgi:hypothetical protein